MSQSSLKNQYNRFFDSVGTESSTLSRSSENISKNSRQSGQNVQNGGGFLDSIFGTDPKRENMTHLIIESIQADNIDALDFLLSRKFVPDLDFVDSNGNNILHALALASRKSSLAMSTLFKIINGDINKKALNQQNSSGNTPLHYAVGNELYQISDIMIKKGAEKIKNNQDFIIITDCEVEGTLPQRQEVSKNTITELDIDNLLASLQVEQPEKAKASIFKPAPPSNPSKSSKKMQRDDRSVSVSVAGPRTQNIDQALDDIVKGFLTSELTVTEHEPKPQIQSQPQAQTQVQSQVQHVAQPKLQSQPQEPSMNISNMNNLDTDGFVDYIRTKLSQKEVQTGGKKKVVKSKKNKKSVISGTRDIRTYSEMSDSMMHEGAVDDSSSSSSSSTSSSSSSNSDSDSDSDSDSAIGLSELSRAVQNQKDKFHAEALEKIKKHLGSNVDDLTAKAVKAVIYGEIKKEHPEFSGLDRVSELIKLSTKEKIDEIMKKNKDDLKQIIEHLKEKEKTREENPKKAEEKIVSSSEAELKEEVKPKKARKSKKTDTESSVLTSTDFTEDSSDSRHYTEY